MHNIDVYSLDSLFKHERELKLSCYYWAQIACVMIRGKFDGTEGSLTLISNQGCCRFIYAIVKVKIASKLYATYRYILYIDISLRVNYHFQNKQKLQVLWHRPKFSNNQEQRQPHWNSLATPCASLYALYWHGAGWPDWTLVDKKVTEAPFMKLLLSTWMSHKKERSTSIFTSVGAFKKYLGTMWSDLPWVKIVKNLLTKLNPRNLSFQLVFFHDMANSRFHGFGANISTGAQEHPGITKSSRESSKESLIIKGKKGFISLNYQTINHMFHQLLQITL